MTNLAELVDQARHHEARAIARLISLVEDGAPQLREALRLLAFSTGHAHIVGITGAPGVGKSTITSALISEYRNRGQRVAVLAIDPSRVNPHGGAIALGHPVGMSGARLALHIAYELSRRGGGIGVAALCGGGGQGDALILRA